MTYDPHPVDLTVDTRLTTAVVTQVSRRHWSIVLESSDGLTATREPLDAYGLTARHARRRAEHKARRLLARERARHEPREQFTVTEDDSRAHVRSSPLVNPDD